jgi:hypothetical protein
MLSAAAKDLVDGRVAGITVGRAKIVLRPQPKTTPVPKPLAGRILSVSIDPLVQVGSKVARDKRIITREGTKWVPLSLAAWLAQTSETTLRSWIEKPTTKFDGKPIQAYVSTATSETYISHESLERMAKRFVKWPSGEPAGTITVGETQDESGYLGLPDAARIVGVSSRTMWLWATQGKAPTDQPLAIVKCLTSDHLYISEGDVHRLQKLERPTGLKRGPKPRKSPHP